MVDPAAEPGRRRRDARPVRRRRVRRLPGVRRSAADPRRVADAAHRSGVPRPTRYGDPTSALLVSGERALAAEFPATVPGAVWCCAPSAPASGPSPLIARAAGGPSAGVPDSALRPADRASGPWRSACRCRPRRRRETRYAVADPYLRFWLSFLGPHLAEIERGRGDLTLDRIGPAWTSWRGRAIEPRRPGGAAQAARRPSAGGGGDDRRLLDPDQRPGDRHSRRRPCPVAQSISFVGSIKWQENRPFDAHDLGRLLLHRSQLPGADEIGAGRCVSRSGTAVDGIRVLSADDLLTAYRN